MRDADHLKVRSPNQGFNLSQINFTPEQMRYLEIKDQAAQKKKGITSENKENLVGKYIDEQRKIERIRAQEEGNRRKIYIGTN